MTTSVQELKNSTPYRPEQGDFALLNTAIVLIKGKSLLVIEEILEEQPVGPRVKAKRKRQAHKIPLQYNAGYTKKGRMDYRDMGRKV